MATENFIQDEIDTTPPYENKQESSGSLSELFDSNSDSDQRNDIYQWIIAITCPDNEIAVKRLLNEISIFKADLIESKKKYDREREYEENEIERGS